LEMLRAADATHLKEFLNQWQGDPGGA
jgi:hypothetical protein